MGAVKDARGDAARRKTQLARRGRIRRLVMSMDRRSFVKAGAALAAGSALIANAAFATEDTASNSADEVAASGEADGTVKASGGVQDGKYVTKALGHENYIYMETTFAGGAIANCRCLRNDETVGVGTYPCEQLPAKIVEAQSVEVDALSGATLTSLAIKRAVREAIDNAGGDSTVDFCTPVETPADGGPQEAAVDVVVVGAGTAGLICAARLLEMGYTVQLFEKQDIPGGSMSMTYGGVAAAGSQLQANYALGRFDDNPMFNVEAMLSLLSAYINPDHDRFDGAMPFQNAMYHNSGALVDWLHSIGVGFYTMGVNSAYGITPYLAPGCYEGGCGYAMEFLVDRVGALGGTIVYGTKVTGLTQDENGIVTGVTAEGKDGSTWTVTANATVLATGGYGASQEMLEKYSPNYAGYIFNCSPCSTGDGIEMGAAIGAAVECTDRELGAFLSSDGSDGSFFELAFLYQTTPGIMVNINGDQFGNITSDNHGMQARALMDPANGETFYHIFDESAAVTTKKNDTYAFDTYAAIFDRGLVMHFDTVEQAAEELNLPNLAATIEKNNEVALTGEPDEWGRKVVPFIDTREGIYAIKVIPTFYLTTGGLAIDTATHVLREDGSVIGCLYAAGDVCGSVEEKDGCNYKMGFDAAMTFGYIMADTINSDLASVGLAPAAPVFTLE